MRQVMKTMPDESIIYLGDSARLPYGTKSDRTIKNFTLQCCLFMLEMGVKMIILACNTASAVALNYVANIFRIPVIGVISPGSEAAAYASKLGRIGVIGTTTTIQSNSYENAILKHNKDARVFQQACPLLVPLAEEGWLDKSVTSDVASEYFEFFLDKDIDTLVLGCTHYPILQDLIQTSINVTLGKNILLIDSGVESAREAAQLLQESKLMAPPGSVPIHRFFVTDLPNNFAAASRRFLGAQVDHPEMVQVESFHS